MPIFRVTKSIPLQSNADLIGELADIGTELARRDHFESWEAAGLMQTAEALMKLSVLTTLTIIAEETEKDGEDAP